jgi:hypothetical protein
MATLITTEIQINSTPENVWKTFVDFENYQHWNPFIKSLKGYPKKGKVITVKIAPPNSKEMTFNPKVLINEANKEFRWKGKLLFKGLFDGEHFFQIKANDDGSTTFIHGEKFTGLIVPFLKKQLNGNTKQGFIAMNQALKEKCEN